MDVEGEAFLIFECGTPIQAQTLEDWLEGESWPDDLDAQMEDKFDDPDDLASLALHATAKGRRVLINAYGLRAPDLLMLILDYAMQKWSNLPSPQGYTFSVGKQPQPDHTSEWPIDGGYFDGGAVVLRRGAEPEMTIGRNILWAALRNHKSPK